MHTKGMVSNIPNMDPSGPSSASIQSRIQRGGFSEIYEKILSGVQQTDLNEQIGGVQKRVLQGEQFSPRELLLLQVSVGRFNMQVELVSKVAESANATLRRLQGS